MFDELMTRLGVSSPERQLLERFRFDATTFDTLRRRLQNGELSPEANRVREAVTPPDASDLTPWPGSHSQAAAECARLGREALARGEVAVAILNGGMATRFGGVVKGVVEVLEGQSFLALKLHDAATAPGPVTVFLMNSFSTAEATRTHLERIHTPGLDRNRLHLVDQSISIRLTPDGDIYRTASGDISCYAPGHGDLLPTLRQSEAFARFVDTGGKYVVVSNVDNLAATVAPCVIGAHIRSGRRATVEVVRRRPGDAGGAPARVAGRLQILEGFRFPKGFEIAQVPVFNTNSFVLSSSVISRDVPLSWFRADKKVDGVPVVQLERLLGEITATVEACYLEVPREGVEGRFLPVKTPADLDTVRPVVRDLVAAWSSGRGATERCPAPTIRRL